MRSSSLSRLLSFFLASCLALHSTSPAFAAVSEADTLTVAPDGTISAPVAEDGQVIHEVPLALIESSGTRDLMAVPPALDGALSWLDAINIIAEAIGGVVETATEASGAISQYQLALSAADSGSDAVVMAKALTANWDNPEFIYQLGLNLEQYAAAKGVTLDVINDVYPNDGEVNFGAVNPLPVEFVSPDAVPPFKDGVYSGVCNADYSGSGGTAYTVDGVPYSFYYGSSNRAPSPCYISFDASSLPNIDLNNYDCVVRSIGIFASTHVYLFPKGSYTAHYMLDNYSGESVIKNITFNTTGSYYYATNVGHLSNPIVSYDWSAADRVTVSASSFTNPSFSSNSSINFENTFGFNGVLNTGFDYDSSYYSPVMVPITRANIMNARVAIYSWYNYIMSKADEWGGGSENGYEPPEDVPSIPPTTGTDGEDVPDTLPDGSTLDLDLSPITKRLDIINRNLNNVNDNLNLWGRTLHDDIKMLLGYFVGRDIASAVQMAISEQVRQVQDALSDVSGPVSDVVSQLLGFYPYNVPTLYGDVLGLLVHDPLTPTWDVDALMPSGGTVRYHFDLSDFDVAVRNIRQFEKLLYVWWLIQSTGELLRYLDPTE